MSVVSDAMRDKNLPGFGAILTNVRGKTCVSARVAIHPWMRAHPDVASGRPYQIGRRETATREGLA